MRFLVLLAVTAWRCAIPADPVPGFAFSDFRSPTGLNLTGAARNKGRILRLTPAARHAAGAVWWVEKQPVRSGFETTFEFRLTRQGGLGRGADGLAFVLQNNGPGSLGGRGSGGGFALGDSGSYGGSAGIPQSIAVFFDTFRNQEIGDETDNSVTICTAGRPKEMSWPPPRLAHTRRLPARLKDGKVHMARILYEPPIVTVYLDNTRILASTVDISTVTDSRGAAWVGFTASTGSGYENHDLLSWSFSRSDVSSDMSVVSSNISFVNTACLPGRNLCTPDRAVIDENGPGKYHIVLPGNLEKAASIPNPAGRPVVIANARGIVCRGVENVDAAVCRGPDILTHHTDTGRSWFSIRLTGKPHEYEGYIEFDAQIE